MLVRIELIYTMAVIESDEYEIVSSIEYTINTIKYHRVSSSNILRVATPGVVSAVTSKFDDMMTIIMCWHIHKC